MNTFIKALAFFAAATSVCQFALAEPVPAGLEGLTQLTSFSARRGVDKRAIVKGGCAAGEVAVGTWQVCSPAPAGICNPAGCTGTDGGCQAELGGIWETNCGGAELASTIMTEGYCSGGWNGKDVSFFGKLGTRCDGSGNVQAVTGTGSGGTADVWNYCYKPSDGFCQWTNGLASKYAHIDWCCKAQV